MFFIKFCKFLVKRFPVNDRFVYFYIMKNLPKYSPLIENWNLDTNIVYLNHGSFGATPKKVLQAQQAIQAEMEAEAIDFFVDKLPTYIDESKTALAAFVGTSSNNIVFTPNTTTGVNTIFNSIACKPGDEWLVTNHTYGACVHAAKHYTHRNGATITTAQIPFPLQTDDEILDAIAAAITSKTTLALIDYITSATATIFPVKKIIELLHSKNIEVLIDAAHAPGMVDLNIDELKADYFVANCHKWICSPKGSAFIYVAPQYQSKIHPLIISHYNDTAEGTAAHWSNQFMFDGTHDYSAYITVKDAILEMQNIAKLDWAGIRNANHELVWTGANKIADAFDVKLPTPKHMVGTICNIPVLNGQLLQHKYMGKTELKQKLFDEFSIEVPLIIFPSAPTQWIRISAQLYNNMDQYDYLTDCLKKLM